MEVIVLNRKKGHQRTYVTRNHHGSVLFLFPLDFVCLFCFLSSWCLVRLSLLVGNIVTRIGWPGTEQSRTADLFCLNCWIVCKDSAGTKYSVRVYILLEGEGGVSYVMDTRTDEKVTIMSNFKRNPTADNHNDHKRDNDGDANTTRPVGPPMPTQTGLVVVAADCPVAHIAASTRLPFLFATPNNNNNNKIIITIHNNYYCYYYTAV